MTEEERNRYIDKVVIEKLRSEFYALKDKLDELSNTYNLFFGVWYESRGIKLIDKYCLGIIQCSKEIIEKAVNMQRTVHIDRNCDKVNEIIDRQLSLNRIRDDVNKKQTELDEDFGKLLCAVQEEAK